MEDGRRARPAGRGRPASIKDFPRRSKVLRIIQDFIAAELTDSSLTLACSSAAYLLLCCVTRVTAE